MTNPRIFKLETPHMHGPDIEGWQSDIRLLFLEMDINCPIKSDGIYGVASRSFSASVCYAFGMNASEVMSEGVTPKLRTRIRDHDFTAIEQRRMDERKQWRSDLRKKYASALITQVHRPVIKIIEDSWGFHPGVHDGLDVICPPNAICFAMIKSKIIDVRASGWWGKSPSGDVSKGDGIVQMEILESVGPFIKGYHIGYGHNEKARVHVGQVVEAGEPVAHAGLAVAWHIHMMYNTGGTSKGIGNLDPRGILNYAVKHG